jgi:hypothetical protein
MLLLTVLVMILVKGENGNRNDMDETRQEYYRRCRFGEDSYVNAREDENAKLKWKCPQDGFDGRPSCMPKKYIEEDWTCIDRYGVSQKCADVGEQTCLGREEYAKARENPCVALNYPAQFDSQWAREGCVDRNIKDLQDRVSIMEDRVSTMGTFLGEVFSVIYAMLPPWWGTWKPPMELRRK